jgi:hypothetical protein
VCWLLCCKTFQRSVSSAKCQKELNEVCCSLWPLYNDYFSIPPNNRNQQLWSCLAYPYRLSSLLPYISHPTINTRWPMIYIIWPMDYMMLPMIIGSLLFVYTKLNCMHIVTLVQSFTNQILHKPIFFWLSCWCGIYVTHGLIICKITSSIGFEPHYFGRTISGDLY